MTAHWFSFGDCPCPAHTILEIRIEPGTANLAPVCPACGDILRYRDHWPAPKDGFGGSSGGLKEVIDRMRRVTERYADDPACAELDVALDALEWRLRTPQDEKIEKPQPSLDEIATAMRCHGIPSEFMDEARKLADESEGAADLMYLWAEADTEERDAIEYDLYRMMTYRKSPSLFQAVEAWVRAGACLDSLNPEQASVRYGLPVSVTRRILANNGSAGSYMGAKEKP